MAKVIVIFSAKGGTGSSFIAANLAVSLSANAAKRTCLADFDFYSMGDLAQMLRLRPQAPMAIMPYSQTLDFLPLVLKPQEASQLKTGPLEEALNILEKNYEYSIIDAGHSFNESMVSALNRANMILLVTTPDVLSIHKTKWVLGVLEKLLFPASMIKVVLNRAESISSISWQEIKVALDCEIISHLPSQGQVAMQAINLGEPVIISAPRSRLSSSINKLADEFIKHEDLFIKHSHLGVSVPQELVPLEKTGEFWEKAGLGVGGPPTAKKEKEDEVIRLKCRIHQRLMDELNIKKLDMKLTVELREKIEKIVTNFLATEGAFIASAEVRRRITKEILDEALGLGPLEDLLADEAISDIMVNNKDEVYIERKGKITLTDKKFTSNEQIRTIIDRIIAPVGRRIDESSPFVDARLTDGSRFNAIIPPLALSGPAITIRKFRKEKLRVEDLIDFGSLTPAMAQFLNACVVGHKNMVISGGTGSGKTTVLNIFSNFIPDGERIITIEDAAELKLNKEHWVRLESKPSNIEGKGAITIRELFRNTLRMRPDRIIVGECRGLEVLDMLQAMNTGHDGSMTTVHANSTQDVISRLDSMILMSGVELPIRAIREMIASAIDIIVHTARLSDGSRRILQITELAGMLDETHINLKDIFVFRQTGINADKNIVGEFRFTGYIPTFIEELKIKSIALSDEFSRAS